MEWESKTEMIRASNKQDWALFNTLVVRNINTFDNQAWDMFFTAIEIIPEQVVKDIEFYKIVMKAYYQNFKDIKIDFRSDLRCELLKEIMFNHFIND